MGQILPLIASAVTIASGLKGLFSSTPKPPAAPAPPKPEAQPLMPTPGDERVNVARRRAGAKRAQASGRLSTILSSDTKLGA